MSRAFMKDPEPGDPRCPSCGSLGEEVGAPTLEAQLSKEDRAALGAAAFYCENPSCRTAYFNAWGAAIPDTRLRTLPYPKNPQGLACVCFGVPAADITADARAGRKDRVKALLDRAKGPEAKCVEKCPDGRSCQARVNRLFRESFEAR